MLKQKWTEEENATLTRLLKAGSTYLEIAKHLPGRGEKSVANRVKTLRKNGMLLSAGKGVRKYTDEQIREVNRLLMEGVPIFKIAEQTGIPSPTIPGIRDRLIRRCEKAAALLWIPTEESRVQELVARKTPLDRIAAITGRPVEVLKERLRLIQEREKAQSRGVIQGRLRRVPAGIVLTKREREVLQMDAPLPPGHPITMRAITGATL